MQISSDGHACDRCTAGVSPVGCVSPTLQKTVHCCPHRPVPLDVGLVVAKHRARVLTEHGFFVSPSFKSAARLLLRGASSVFFGAAVCTFLFGGLLINGTEGFVSTFEEVPIALVFGGIGLGAKVLEDRLEEGNGPASLGETLKKTARLQRLGSLKLSVALTPRRRWRRFSPA